MAFGLSGAVGGAVGGSVGGSVGIRVCPDQNKNIYQSFIFVDSQTFSYKKPTKKRHVVTHKKTHTRFLQCGFLVLGLLTFVFFD